MTKRFAFGRLLLLSTALIAPGALAQTPAPITSPGSTEAPADAVAEPSADAPGPAQAPAEAPAEDIDISVPGGGGISEGDIVVTGRYVPEAVRATPEVVSVLSSADIARTGEGDIAGALQRVTGLSVVGNGFVFVRGLGDRYSLALLNGSPLPSPEPLRRVVPLDIFPTSVIASSLVQKSYSVNFPGEFGGGVINLTTKAIPTETYLDIGVSLSGDTETTAKLGYTYYGSKLDRFGFDDGTRDLPSGLRDAIASGNPIVQGPNFSSRQLQDLTASLRNAETTLLQRNFDIPANVSADLSFGTARDLSNGRIGLIFAAGYNNSWRTRDAIQQTSLDPGLAGTPQTDFRTVSTDNRIVVNGLLGVGAEFGDHKLRWTNLYIRDSLKQGRLSAGSNRSVRDQDPGLPPTVIEQNTYWFERQLIDTQIVGEFRFGDLSLDLRGTYANSQRESPYERDFTYVYLGDGDPTTKGVGDVDDYVNSLSGSESARVAFNDLNENVYAGGADLGYKLPTANDMRVTAGYNYSKTSRTSSRYQFEYRTSTGSGLPLAVAQERPDYLLSDYNIYTYGIEIRDVSGAQGAAVYSADLRIHAGYVQLEAEIFPELKGTIGVRYEDAVQQVQPIGAAAVPALRNDYFLPAATVTWNFVPNMQLRVHGSKTIARPQFRELAPQVYQDFESDREFSGNPFLTDSRLTNAEARYEWYFDRGERLTVAGFYKKIDNPIETVAFFAGGGQLRSGFSNAPSAQLYGGELELQKYVPLDSLGGGFFETKRLVLIGNYTYSKSKIKADDSLVVLPNVGVDFDPDNPPVIPANLIFRDGAPLTGQSDHIGNIQIGIEDTEKLSQATILLTYASERVTNRGPFPGPQPDIVEKPGLRVDFVAREEVDFLGQKLEIKFEARNLFGRGYQEFQQAGDNRIDINSYDVGTSVSLGVSAKF